MITVVARQAQRFSLFVEIRRAGRSIGLDGYSPPFASPFVASGSGLGAMKASPLTVLGGYACHVYHWPPPEDADYHHVVPRAWQMFANPSHYARRTDGIWYPETARLTPSCHRAVHNRIVAIMKAYAQTRVGAEPVDEQLAAVLDQVSGRGKLWAIAEQAPLIWLNEGGSLRDLCGARLWGDS